MFDRRERERHSETTGEITQRETCRALIGHRAGKNEVIFRGIPAVTIGFLV